MTSDQRITLLSLLRQRKGSHRFQLKCFLTPKLIGKHFHFSFLWSKSTAKDERHSVASDINKAVSIALNVYYLAIMFTGYRSTIVRTMVLTMKSRHSQWLPKRNTSLRSYWLAVHQQCRVSSMQTTSLLYLLHLKRKRTMHQWPWLTSSTGQVTPTM